MSKYVETRNWCFMGILFARKAALLASILCFGVVGEFVPVREASAQSDWRASDGDIEARARAMMRLMDDGDLRKRMSVEASKVVDTYSEKKIMEVWTELFRSLAAQ